MLAALSTLRELIEFSRSNAWASHLVVIPFVSVALVAHRRAEIFRVVRTQWSWGSAMMGLGLAVYLLRPVVTPAAPSDALAIAVGGLLIVWVGGFLVLFGSRATGAARFPLGLLALAVPIPAALLGGFNNLLRYGSAEVLGGLLAVTGTPVHREGYVFSFPGVAIEVAKNCTGIRSTIALALTALLAGHIYLPSGWRVALLALAALLIGILKNGLRILSLVLIANYVDPAILQGRLHRDGGIGYFLLGLALLLPLFVLLGRTPTAWPLRSHWSRSTSRP